MFAKKKEKNKYKFIPEMKIKVAHNIITNIVWPISGCRISKIKIGKIKIKLKIYLKYNSLTLLSVKITLNDTIINGFKISIGWNLGRKTMSIHRFDPLTSAPIKGTNIKDNKDNINNNKHNFISLSFSRNETVRSIKKLNKIKTKCLKKK